MPTFSNFITYIFLFISLYFEVFLLITYLERRHDIKRENATMYKKLSQYPTVTILVPCWNEEMTLAKTLDSLLALDYPKDKLSIIAIDDGSTDGTWRLMQDYTKHPQIEVYTKENGGKHSALNFGLTKVKSQFVGCLDADSYVDSQALKHIIPYFADPEVMAVTPSVKVWKPKNIIELIQKVEYGWGIFIRKLFSYLNALYVTPGPFSIFRVEVFQKIGGYRYAHQTEDMEIAMRMQSNHFKMVNAHNARVYTVAPESLKKLYKQRVRWTYGFINNVIDYRYMLFKREYGNLGIYVLPMATLSVGSGLYIIFMYIGRLIQSLTDEYVKIQTVGWNFHAAFNFDWFYVNTEFIALASTIAFLGTLTLVLLSRKMAEGKIKIGLDLIYYLALYAFIAPLWLGKAIWNTLFSVKATWR